MKSSGAGIGGALPFRIDRAATKSLVDQMVDGVKAAVASGRYGPGARLPSVRAMADLAGVSLIVPRLAIQRLEREEIVVTRPRIGTIVRAPMAADVRLLTLCSLIVWRSAQTLVASAANERPNDSASRRFAMQRIRRMRLRAAARAGGVAGAHGRKRSKGRTAPRP